MYKNIVIGLAPGKSGLRVDQTTWKIKKFSTFPAEALREGVKAVKAWSNEGEGWCGLAGESLRKSFLNSHALLKREQELY